MAWMTYISSWFEQDDWYEGLQRVSYIYVLTFYAFFCFTAHSAVLLCHLSFSYFTLQNSECK